MIVMHMAYGLDMIALSAGTALLLWSMKSPGKGSWLGKLIGALVMIFSIISIVCLYSCVMRGGECHGPRRGEGMMMGAPPPPPGGEMGHERGNKKVEHRRS